MPAATPLPSSTARGREPSRAQRAISVASVAAICQCGPSRPMLPPLPIVQADDTICSTHSRSRIAPLRSCTRPIRSAMPNGGFLPRSGSSTKPAARPPIVGTSSVSHQVRLLRTAVDSVLPGPTSRCWIQSSPFWKPLPSSPPSTPMIAASRKIANARSGMPFCCCIEVQEGCGRRRAGSSTASAGRQSAASSPVSIARCRRSISSSSAQKRRPSSVSE